MPSFKIIVLLVLENKIFKGFCHIWAWRPSWSCDLDYLYKLSFPLIVRQRNSIFLKKRAIPSIENVFVYSDRYCNSGLKPD